MVPGREIALRPASPVAASRANCCIACSLAVHANLLEEERRGERRGKTKEGERRTNGSKVEDASPSVVVVARVAHLHAVMFINDTTTVVPESIIPHSVCQILMKDPSCPL